MNWHHFLFCLTIGYGIYYTLNILYDIFSGRATNANIEQPHEIILPPQVTPKKVSIDALNNDSTNKETAKSAQENYSHTLPCAPNQANGGVKMQELVALMGQHVIQFTKAIPY